MSIFDWAPFRKTKAAIKLHTLLDLRGSIPAFIHINDGKMADVKVLDILPIETGAFYVMDRGYVHFARLYKIHQAGAFFVTRAKLRMNARRVYSAVKTQIWSAIARYVLVAIVKQELKLELPLYTLLQILSISIFEKIEISEALQPSINRSYNGDEDNQLSLFDF